MWCLGSPGSMGLLTAAPVTGRQAWDWYLLLGSKPGWHGKCQEEYGLRLTWPRPVVPLNLVRLNEHSAACLPYAPAALLMSQALGLYCVNQHRTILLLEHRHLEKNISHLHDFTFTPFIRTKAAPALWICRDILGLTHPIWNAVCCLHGMQEGLTVIFPLSQNSKSWDCILLLLLYYPGLGIFFERVWL